MKEVCCFICNQKYLQKFLTTYNNLRNNGKYNGDVLLIVGNDLKDYKKEGLIVKYFPDIEFPKETYDSLTKVKTCDGRNINKYFQWHKLYIFDVYLKQWDVVFYIDAGMKIMNDIRPILNSFKKEKLLAHDDAMIDGEYHYDKMRLKNVFDEKFTKEYEKLNENYDLTSHYFQTGIMLFDTNIIEENTFKELYELVIKYPITKTNEQGIMDLYFTKIRPLWEQIPTKNKEIYFYDYCKRRSNRKYIMVKY
tara:strand:- start:10769 stop:11518 length:750 start_codon:yes stop_codon:yes gene_type:complete